MVGVIKNLFMVFVVVLFVAVVLGVKPVYCYNVFFSGVVLILKINK